MHTNTTAASFLTRKSGTKRLIVVQGEYEGPIPAKTLAAMTKAVIKMEAGGMFFPLDAMDIYQTVFAQLTELAANPPSGMKDRERYLTGAMRIMLLHIVNREVKAKREEYRNARTEDHDIFDMDLMGGWQAYVQTRRYMANRDVREVLRHLPKDTARAFRAWLAADGKIGEAAKLAGESRFKFMREWNRRCAEFRKIYCYRKPAGRTAPIRVIRENRGRRQKGVK